ncbi:tetratricopeptide repeat protein [Neorhodopirellula pilleata]|uniref:Protein disulfide-isomerase n=1 Tax=Neorhodopirellula pilleata TaxID=2714738 RepID=A0A5C6A4L7_9BACT|nr:protein-disulfide isomerase [Neorhodopirellula pilleata]TWT94892.1 hypothetical protein Pla100_34630 [Neorhodopirellula pilleata]
MSIDTYAICPCGSGKKIKFCKCKDSVHELDRVLKMVEGGQLVPALDRLSTILKDHPDAAWALAIRGRLLMDLREYQSLTENAERFTRLQPSNPLALTQSAAAAMFNRDLGKATELLLEALTESGQMVDSFVLDVASMLSYGLAGNGILLTARIYATLAFVSDGYENQSMAANVLQQINRDPNVNMLAKMMPDLIPRPDGVDWAERYDEAALLLANNKIVLAENKFDSLQRSAPMQPSVLSGLFTCAIWRGDFEQQIELLKKLSQCESLSLDDRARFLAMSFVVGPESGPVAIKKLLLTGEIGSIDETMISLSANSRFTDLPSDVLHQLKGDQEVGPRAAYQMLDRDPPESEGVPASDLIPETIGLVTVYGRETDRSARVEVIGVDASMETKVRELLAAAVPNVEFQSEVEGTVPLATIAAPQPGGLKLKDAQEFETVQKLLFDDRAVDNLANATVELLDGGSLASTSGDETKQLQRAAIVRYLEGEDNLIARDESIIHRLSDIANVPAPEVITPTGDDVEEIPAYNLNRVDATALDIDNLVYLIQRAQQISATKVGRAAAQRLTSMDVSSDGEMAGVKLLGYTFMMQHASSVDEVLENLDSAKAYAAANNMSTASLLLTELPLRLRLGQPEKFQECVQSIMSQYGNNPEVMGQLQQILVRFGLIRPDGSPVQRPQAAPAAVGSDAGGGLWTPDGGSKPAAQGAEGGSKLWVPGMD